MGAQKQIRMKVTRAYPRGLVTHSVGAEITVPEYVAASMEDAQPPYGKRLGVAPAAAAPAEPTSDPAPVPEPDREYVPTDGSVTAPTAEEAEEAEEDQKKKSSRSGRR